ncbi:hypothetical protein ABEB36_001105 [Hypothenemus hampei]|uniref:Adenosine 3'-phospho 5'-phosphosulfate transporter 2 n=1 Tax=Hypothenemus hampei TaxID=57062 RepID=A0ABD1FFD6_HYPHA
MARKQFLDLDPQPEKPKASILCLEIASFSETWQLVLCSIAVFFFYLLYGYMQELIFTIKDFKPYGWYLTLVQFGCYTIFGLMETKIRGINNRRIPIKTYLLLALLTLGTMGLSNSSLGYLNYPTQVIFKCCKLIPVMAGGILIQGKRYGPLDFLAALLMCVGLTLFTLADSQVQPNFDTKGISMISLALLCDAVIGNVQEKSMKSYMAPNVEVVLYSYAIGFVYLLVIMLSTGNLMEGINFFNKQPYMLYGYSVIFSVTGYLGIQVVLTLVRTTGAFAAVTVTTMRKAVTIIISFIFFSKPFTMQYLWSGSIVVFGIYLNLFSKKHPMGLSDFEECCDKLLRVIRTKLLAKQYSSGQYLANV